MKAFDDDGTELIRCTSCENGQWESECCNGAGGCSCRVCKGSGWKRPDADAMANAKHIRAMGQCFLGSGPSSGYWAGK
jgi:hypothetical protein